LLILTSGACGGLLIAFLNGIDTPRIFGIIPSIKTRPILSNFFIPPLIGMLLCGFLVRNIFNDTTLMSNYPVMWTTWMRNICLATLLIRAGLAIEKIRTDNRSKGITLTLILIILIP
jgi:hypothetical protein